MDKPSREITLTWKYILYLHPFSLGTTEMNLLPVGDSFLLELPPFLKGSQLPIYKICLSM